MTTENLIDKPPQGVIRVSVPRAHLSPLRGAGAGIALLQISSIAELFFVGTRTGDMYLWGGAGVQVGGKVGG